MYKVYSLLNITQMAKSKKSSKKATRKANYAVMAAPKATLDFHEFGPMREDEIAEKVRNFVVECVGNRLDRVLIITGKGTHSRDGISVVRPIVEDVLLNIDEVDSFSGARRDRGGEGAIEVRLG